MGIKHVAAIAAVAASVFAAPAHSQSFGAQFGEVTSPMTSFFVAIPLDGSTRKEQEMNFGLKFQGSRPYQAVKVDYKTFKFLDAAIAGLEAKYIIAGAVALGVGVAMTKKDKTQSQSFQEQQAAQQAACPEICAQ